MYYIFHDKFKIFKDENTFEDKGKIYYGGAYFNSVCAFDLEYIINKDVNLFIKKIDLFLITSEMRADNFLHIIAEHDLYSINILSNYMKNDSVVKKEIQIDLLVIILQQMFCFSAYKSSDFLIDYISKHYYINTANLKYGDVFIDMTKMFMLEFNDFNDFFIKIDKLNNLFLDDNIDIYNFFNFKLPFDVNIKNRKNMIFPYHLSTEELIFISKYKVDIKTIMTDIKTY